MNNRYASVQRPEAALQRANDFISVGKEADALNALYDERRQRTWSEVYEQIMLKHVELCVNLRNTALAKDGLFQYRVFTQQVSAASLKTVVEHFLSLAEEKTQEAQKKSIESVDEIDDLDVADAPERLLQTVSGAAHQDRMDRTVLSPWLRFLWDSYRNCLDMLRNNNLVEEIYHHVARQSFAFCARYQRRNEFRKLCELLRIHLSQIQKSQNPTEFRQHDFRIKLNSAESLAHMQETRLCQLNTAIQMELWQEAYKSAEDLHNIMQLSKDHKDRRMAKPANLVNYYDKLALIFWKGGNTLFHAAALLQKYVICKDMKRTFTDEEAIEQASRVLLATLSIPHGQDSSSVLTKLLDIEDQHISNVRTLTALLRLPVAPTRAGLLKEITLLNITEQAAEPVRHLYKLLEQEFSPLNLATRTQAQLNELDKLGRDDYSQYIETLKGVVATKVIRQLTVIYDSLSLDRFERVIPFYNRHELEHFLVQTSKHRSVKASISHLDNCVRFNALDLTLAGGMEAGLDIDAASNGIEYVREHLVQLHAQLRDAVYQLDGPKFREHAEQILKYQVKVYLQEREQDYERMLQRRKMIENYKETTETQRKEKQKQEQEEQAKREEQRRAEEKRRLDEQNKENERKRKETELDEIRSKQKLEQLNRFKQNPVYQQIMKERGEEVLMNMDPELVLKEQRERMDAERRETQNKLRQQEKKFDHMVRAFFIEELECYKQMSDEYLQTAPQRYEECEERRIQKETEDHARSIETHERMNLVRPEAEEFLKARFAVHTDDFENLKGEWRRKLEVEKRRRLEERKQKRKEARREEADRRRRDEEERAKQAAEQAQRDQQERQRQETREMHQRLKEKQMERERVSGARDFQDLRSTIRDVTGGGTGGTWRQGQTTGGGGGPLSGDARRDGAPNGAPRREPRVVANAAPENNSWRSDARPASGGPTSQPMPPRRQQPAVDGTGGGGGGNWRRDGPPGGGSPAPPGNQQAPPQQQQRPAAAPTKPGAYVPPHLRNRQ
ncbi:Eukaryotic translation initiation factor 3 subunit A [Aphelenchoides fujianensis]|nr:Eukaryotic translation initiation factor 3 subunit A [Aphelenchoides fujianensis]